MAAVEQEYEEEQEEEEEEEEEFWRPPPRRMPQVVQELPREEGVLTAAGPPRALAPREDGGGLLRRRRPPPEGPTAGPAQPSAAATNLRARLWEEEGEDFGLGSERLPAASPLPTPDMASTPVLASARHQVTLGLFVVAALATAAAERRPSEASFRVLCRASYGEARNGTGAGGPGVPAALEWLVLVDRSFQGRVAWSRYVSHGPVALGTVALTVASGQASGAKGKAAPKKVYEHRYLGILGHWVPLPYLPQPGQKPGTYGVGACVLAHCVCLPNLRQSPGRAAGGGRGGAARGCWRFQGGKSAALNVMALPNMLLFGLWQWPSNWGLLAGHASLSPANLCRGRLWVLLAAPFSHRSWGEIFRSGVLLANAVDSFDRAGVSFAVFLALYLGGCWAAWLARGVLWRRLLKNDSTAFYTQEWGASGGLAAQLLFLARARPEERFQFSLYFMPLPLELSAWQSLFAHGLLDIFCVRGGVLAEVLAHLAAWTFGWILYDAWSRHL